jgi:uncharacterized protein (DUF697 family)
MNTVVEKEPLSRSEQSSKIVRNYAIGTMVPSLIPVPMLDLVVVTGIQLKMLHSLSQVYGVEFKEDLGRASIASLIGGTVALSASRVVASAVKAIPGIGSLVGAATMPVVSGGTTYALGQVFTQHFESGGTLLDFDAAKMRQYFEQQFVEGKAMVAAAKASGDSTKPK